MDTKLPFTTLRFIPFRIGINYSSATSIVDSRTRVSLTLLSFIALCVIVSIILCSGFSSYLTQKNYPFSTFTANSSLCWCSMQSSISSSVNKNFSILLILTLASITLLIDYGNARRGSYRIWNKPMRVNVISGDNTLSNSTYIANVALTMSIGLVHKSNTFMHPTVNLFLNTYISFSLNMNNLSMK